MRTEGSTASGTSYSGHDRDLGLPKPTTVTRSAHRPWCVDCKRHHDPDQLDDNQRCTKCARAAASRARAAERREREAEARVEAAKREKAAQRVAQSPSPAPDRARSEPPAPSHAAVEASAGEAPTPSVRAKISQHTPDVVIIALQGTGITSRQTEVAALLADLLHGLNTTTAPAPATPRRTAPRRTAKPRRTSSRRGTFPLAKAQRLYLEDHHTCDQIATQLGCSVHTVRRHLKNAGTPMRDDRANSGGRNAKTTHDDDPHLRELIVTRYTGGESTVQIAADLDTSTKRVNNVLRRAGIPIRPQAHVGKPIDVDDVIARYTRGDTLVDIARDLHLKKTRVRQTLVDAGVTIRSRGDSHTATTALMNELGVTARDVKRWAYDQGLIDHLPVGRVNRRLVDAYAAAHNNESGATA